jgi:hypothetical protein
LIPFPLGDASLPLAADGQAPLLNIVPHPPSVQLQIPVVLLIRINVSGSAIDGNVPSSKAASLEAINALIVTQEDGSASQKVLPHF